MNVNMNEVVSVVLTESGAVTASRGGLLGRSAWRAGDTLETQLWSLFSAFGSRMYMGGSVPFVDNVITFRDQQPHRESIIANRLRAFQVRHGMRPDWHEPDEQDVTAEVIGDHLDNAYEEQVLVECIDTPPDIAQELVIELRCGSDRERFNLATLMAELASFGRRPTLVPPSGSVAGDEEYQAAVGRAIDNFAEAQGEGAGLVEPDPRLSFLAQVESGLNDAWTGKPLDEYVLAAIEADAFVRLSRGYLEGVSGFRPKLVRARLFDADGEVRVRLDVECRLCLDL